MGTNPVTFVITNDQNYILLYFKNGGNENAASPLLAPFSQVCDWLTFFTPAEEIVEPRALIVDTPKGELELSLTRSNGHYHLKVNHPEAEAFTFKPSPDEFGVAYKYFLQVKQRRNL